MNPSLQVAIVRARLVARSDYHRAVAILRAARIRLDSCIAIVARFVGAASFVALTACGGGDDPGTAAEAAAKSGTQPVSCPGVTGLACQ